MNLSNNETAQKAEELPMYLQRPSSGHSQDVRHILARSFRDLYTRDPISQDMLKNLQVSKGSDDPYHEQYVEKLQKVYTEWRQRMDEIAMLERHIMQAQARAMSAEERELNKASMACENYKDLGLPPVKSHFRSCIDTQLLREHNLLTPSDYLVPDPLPVPDPTDAKTPVYANEAAVFSQHSRPDKVRPKTSTGHENMEFQAALPDGKDKDGIRKEEKKNEIQATFPKKHGWKELLSEEQREADRKYLNNLQAKANYMQNPRYILNPVPPNGRSLLKVPDKKSKLTGIKKDPEKVDENLIIFVPVPHVVKFTSYKIGEVYEITLELKNMSTVMRQCRVLPPSTNVFSVGLGQFPGDSGLVAPGLSCKYNIRFTPHSLRNYDDFITVEVQATYPLIIPLKARRPLPVLTLPNEVDIGSCLINGIQSVQLLVKNEGGNGRFCLMPRSKWPTSSIRSVLSNVMKTTIKTAPFEIYPAIFELNSGQSAALEVIFNPSVEKTYIQDLTIACDNCNIAHFRLKGKGEFARVSLDDVELGLAEAMPGEFVDISTKNLVRFEDLNPFTYTERVAKIRNCTKTELCYHWMVYKPIKASCISDDQSSSSIPEEERVPDLQSAFSILPSNGVLHPSQTDEFRLIFAPSAEGNFHSIAHMVLHNVPSHRTGMPISSRRTTYDAEGQSKEDYSFFDVMGNLPFKDVTALGFDMKGKCVPLNVVLHPYALIIKAQVVRGSTIRKLFTMANHSYSCITFRWESFIESYIIEIEPPFGELDPGMAMDFEIRVTGVQPGKISHTMLCHIMNRTEPLHFLVQAEFSGPELKIEEPSINFGLIRIGQCEIREMTIINTSETVVKFTIIDCPVDAGSDDLNVPSILNISEVSGELHPFGRKTVTLTLIPTCVQTIRRMCTVQYENGKSCSVAVYGEAQNPVVCFLECQKFLPEVYLDIPAVFTVVLHNKTLLPTTFKWGTVEGSQCRDCKIEVLEEEGEILSWQQKKISIAFTPLKAVSFSEVRLPCHISGQDDDIYINISCHVQTLNVSYKVSTDGQQFIDNLELHFGEVPFGEVVKRYVHICNQTAISASYSAVVEHFVAPLTCLEVNEAETAASQQRGLLSRTRNIDGYLNKTTAQMTQEYNKLVLSNNAGVAFVVCPSHGKLKPFGTQIIEISAHSDLWGNYKDKFICKVGELEEVKIPISFNVIGCPLNLQLAAGQPGKEAFVRFGSHVTGTSVTRKLRINNSSPIDLRVDWQVFKTVDVSDQLIDFITYYGRAFPRLDSFGGEVDRPISGSIIDSVLSGAGDTVPYHLEIAPVKMETSADDEETEKSTTFTDTHSTTTTLTFSERPQVVFCTHHSHSGIRTTESFSAKPPQLIVPAKGSNTVDFTFAPKSSASEETDFLGYVLGYLSLVNEGVYSDHVTRSEAYDAEHLRFSYSAHLRPALLTVEELDEDGMTFFAAISDIVKENEIQSEFLHIHSIKLRNDTQTPLTFKMEVNEPFLLMGLDPSCDHQECNRTKATLLHTLKPQHYFVSKVAFRVSKSLLSAVPKQSGEYLNELDRKLTFEDELNIQFNNGAEQKVPLYATLAIPQVELSEEFLDFGLCLVGQTRELVFDVLNTSASHCFWQISIENRSDTCDDDTFQAQPKKGMLEAHITHVSKSKVTVKVFFTAKHSDSYDCTYVVQGVLGERPRRLVVTGQGSYDGKNEAILDV